MKKIFWGLVAVLVIIIGAGCVWYKVNYGTTPYYVQLTQDGKSEKINYNNGTSGTLYRYNLTGYDKSGKSQQVKLIESRILKHDAYLKVAYSKKENVISWEEVKKSEVPGAALEELNSRK